MPLLLYLLSLYFNIHIILVFYDELHVSYTCKTF